MKNAGKVIIISIIVILFGIKTDVLAKSGTDEPFIDFTYYDYICEISEDYGICPELVCAIIWRESRWQNVNSKNCIGFMQINPKWHAERMERLGVDDLTDEEQNILVGIDYLAELFEKDSDLYWVLMTYNGSSNVNKKIEQGKITNYAISVSEISEQFERDNGK